MIAVQLHLSPAHNMIEQVLPVENADETSFTKKPKHGTGLWTSTFREDSQDSAWVEWCRWEEYGKPYEEHWHLLTPRDDVRVYIINSSEDLDRLIKTYPYEPLSYKQVQRGLDTYYARFLLSIDYERLRLDYEALHLTEKGNEELHLNFHGGFDLNAWDCESTVWFRWCFAEVRKIEAPVLV